MLVAATLITLACLAVASGVSAQEPYYEVDIPAQTVAKALEQLAAQTGSITLFPYNLVSGKQSTAIRGRYTLPEALSALLKNTELSGVLAEERIISIQPLNTVGSKLVTGPDSVGASSALDSKRAAKTEAATPMAVESPATLEEIRVTGIRGSLEQSAQIKRRSRGIVDAITAEELGKFPDINVAESLQRITGVGITRTRGGEGQFVTVRGLGEEFNAVTYNGRLLATENTGREFSFDVIASELIAGAEVYKSLTASQGDGSLGGRVNIRTARPMDGNGFRASAALAAQYEELAEEWGPRASAVIANTSQNDRFGFTASVSYQKRHARTDVAESIFLIPNVQVDSDGLINARLDADGDGFNDNTGAAITHTNVRVNSFAPSVSFQERERIGGTLALQWLPNNSTNLLVDALYTKFDSPGALFGYSFFPSAGAGNFVGTNAVVNDRNQAVAFDIEPFALDLVSRITEGRAETLAFGTNLEKTVSNKLTLIGDVSFSQSRGNRDNFGSANGSGTFFVLGYPSSPRWSFDSAGRLTPNAVFSAENVEGDGFRTPIESLTANDIRLHFARRDTIDVKDDIVSVKGDIQYAFSESTTFEVGIDYVSREKANTAFDNSGADRQGVLRGYRTSIADVSPGLVPGLLTLFDDNFLGDAPGNFPRAFPTFQVSDVEQAFADAGLAQALIPTRNAEASNVVEEDVLGAYFQFALDGMFGPLPYDFGFGIRFAQTELQSTGALATIDSITGSLVLRDDDGVSLSSGQAFTVDPAVPTAIENSYFDVLPTLTFSMDVADDAKLRVAASRSLSRPTLTDLSTRYTITSTNLGGEQITAANPLLGAIRSSNFDASVEWYGDNGSYLSAAVFYKDLSDFVTSRITRQSIVVPRIVQELDGTLTDVGSAEVTFLVASPANGDSATINGIEVGGQYFFENGFGIAGNVTATDSESETNGQPSELENISDLSWNASVFYEQGGLQARASLNHRSDYLIGQTIEGGLDEYGDDFTQLDLSFSYSLTSNETDYTVFLEGINVTNEKVIRLSEFPDSDFLESYEDNGARYVIGIRANF